MSGYTAIVMAVVGAVSSISQAQQQKNAAKYNQKVAENQAVAARQEAAANADTQRRKAAKTIGSMQASYAASGVSMEGSPLEVLEESARNAELDRLSILWSGDTRAMGYEATSKLENNRASNAMASGMLSAAGSAFKGFASSYSPTANAGSTTSSNSSSYGAYESPDYTLGRGVKFTRIEG